MVELPLLYRTDLDIAAAVVLHSKEFDSSEKKNTGGAADVRGRRRRWRAE